MQAWRRRVDQPKRTPSATSAARVVLGMQHLQSFARHVGVDRRGRDVSVAGRGEREPAVATADEVAEARNRRVEIKLR